MLEKLSRDDTRDVDAISELSRNSRSRSLSRKQRTKETTEKKKRKETEGRKRRTKRDGEADEGVVNPGRVKKYFNTEQTSAGRLPGLAG